MGKIMIEIQLNDREQHSLQIENNDSIVLIFSQMYNYNDKP